MTRIVKAFFLASIMLAFTASAFASVQHRPAQSKRCSDCGNKAVTEESYASVSFLAGLGAADDRFGHGDVTTLSALLDYPVAEQFSLLARWDHENVNWDDRWAGRWGAPSIGDGSERNVFSFGLRVTLK